MSCIGQTSRDLTQRHREHIRYIRNNDPQSAYAQHILRNQHEYGTTTDTVTVLKPVHKTANESVPTQQREQIIADLSI